MSCVDDTCLGGGKAITTLLSCEIMSQYKQLLLTVIRLKVFMKLNPIFDTMYGQFDIFILSNNLSH